METLIQAEQNPEDVKKEEIMKEILKIANSVKAADRQRKDEIRELKRTAKKIITLISCVLVAVLLLVFVSPLYHTANSSVSNDGYVIENLQGDAINTWVSWNLIPEETLQINIVNSAKLSEGQVDAVKDAILSNGTAVIHNSVFQSSDKGSTIYYLGWEGALNSIPKKPTEYYIPVNFQITESPNKMGDITIYLVKDSSPDGLSGYTKSAADGNQILSSKITIYHADRLSSNELGAITRHEFGHALGLAHSKAQYDLMHTTIQTQYPYISQCDVEAISKLYSGMDSSQVICDK